MRPPFKPTHHHPDSSLDAEAWKDYLCHIAPSGVAVYTAVNESPLTPAIFDRLRQATAKDPSVLAELCREYLTEARGALVQVREALRSRNAGMLRDRAHYLKGSSMMIGATVLSQHCAALEKMGRDADFAATELALQQAETALTEVERELTKLVGPEVLPAEGSAA